MFDLKKLVYTPAGASDATLAIAACRAGGVGIFNAELDPDPGRIGPQLDFLAGNVEGEYGLKLDVLNRELLSLVEARTAAGLAWLVIDAQIAPAFGDVLGGLRDRGVRVLVEVSTGHWPGASLEDRVDGIVLKGNESGGFVGELGSFILFQRWRAQTSAPLYLRGGVTPHVAAAVAAVGGAGVVLDSQLLLLEESPLAGPLGAHLGNLSGNETVAAGDPESGQYFRFLVRPTFRCARALVEDAEAHGPDSLREWLCGRIRWEQPEEGVLPLGQDVCFATPWRKRYGNVASVFRAIDAAVADHPPQVLAANPLSNDGSLARELSIPLPIVQGPMTRVSDRAPFAKAVAEQGALPMLALALMKREGVEHLLQQTRELLGDHPWGIGLLGFAPQELLDEQIAAARAHRPSYAIIAGGRPDQAARLEKAGIPSFLHVPSANLLALFLQEGARRFIFEGRECGGHIGPLNSFVLWSSMVDRLLDELDDGGYSGADVQVLFAGGIHDSVSSAMVQVLAAPLLSRNVKVGILMGSAYLFTREIVSTGAVVAAFQQEMLDSERTVSLESGPGHASCCAHTRFAREFFEKRRDQIKAGVPADEARKVLDELILGRLRIASKGRARRDGDGELVEVNEEDQRREGMYMSGQLVTMRDEVGDIASLHRAVTDEAALLLATHASATASQPDRTASAAPVDVAVIGIGCLLPGASSTREFWENIVAKFDAITEIPRDRWDWRLYFDEDRQARDKIYSKWGGFLHDLPFDPTRYGIPPRSIESVDPMQLMALEVARKSLVDAGYEAKSFDRERASVIIGASGGTGDVGMQYGLRAELPRFNGELPGEVASRLPEWSEDTFAGILINVLAGRIANRFNFGGVNFTTDAACASSLAAVYQAVTELVSGRSDIVVAGGVDTVQGPFGYLCFSKTQALSPTGRSRAFDSSADGIVISEGIAMVVLKRLKDAERDGDRIYSVIKGIAGGSDGGAKGLAAPLPDGQLRAMRRAYEQANFGPETVGLFEAHATGTVAGDSAELESTSRLVSEARAGRHQAVVSSIKTMIGHTKATAGVAGLIKASLALHHRVLPPQLWTSDEPNAALREADASLYLIDEAQPWLEGADGPRRASVSSFGFGGTNFHATLEEYAGEYRPWLRSAPSQRWPVELFLWSGDDRNALVAQLAASRSQLACEPDLELRDLACALASQWRIGVESLTIVASSFGDLAHKLDAAIDYLEGGKPLPPADIHHEAEGPQQGKVAVLFSGQGSQYTGMLREVAVHFPVCADMISEADVLLADEFSARFGEGVRLSHFVFPRGCYGEDAKQQAAHALTGTDVAQPALGVVGAALWRLMCELGLRADMLGGHSYGEFTALYAGGAVDFMSLMSISAARGRFIVDEARAAGAELGTMAAVQAARSEVETVIVDIDGVVVANQNAPHQSIISGSRAGIERAIGKFGEMGVNATPLDVAAAFHSRFVEPARARLGDLIATTKWREMEIPVYSNTTGEPHAGGTEQLVKTMTEHLVEPVEFEREVNAMYRDGARIFVELGPKAVLTRLVGRILGDRPHTAVAIDDHGGGLRGLLNAVGRLLCAGVDLDATRLFEGRDPLPCDPEDLGAAHRTEPLPKHAWMLNGSAARRAGEPPKQVGVRFDERDTSVAAPATTGRPVSAMTTTADPRARQPVVKSSEKECLMRERKRVPTVDASEVMAQYFDTMRQFLVSQENVMGSYFGGSATSSRSGRRARQIPPIAAGNGRDVEQPLQPLLNARMEAESQALEPTTLPPPPAATASPPTAQQKANGAEAANGSKGANGYDRERITDLLYELIEARTGYPRDLVGMEQNLEADLGIDSIKRVEIVGALLQTLPDIFSNALGENRSMLHRQPTLSGILEMLVGLGEEGAPDPFDRTGAGTAADAVRHLPRYVLEAAREPIDARALRRLEVGHFLITEGRSGVADALADLLTERGCSVHRASRELVADEAAFSRWCATRRQEIGSVTGIVHLAPLGSEWIARDAPVTEWRAQLQCNQKSLFLLLGHFAEQLHESAHVLSASALGGLFNRKESVEPGLSVQGGDVGLLKSLLEERPSLRVKAVDVDPVRPAADIASDLLGELELLGGRQEVGYPAGERTIFRTVASFDDAPGSEQNEGIQNAVILATGGAKGITAEALRALARPGNTLVITGRSPLPEPEPQELQSLGTAAELRRHFIEEVRAGRSQWTPAEIQRGVKSILGARELVDNLEDLRRRGASVEYHSVDVTDEESMCRLMDGLYQRHGAIHGVVHGAGVIEDRLLSDKTSESWSRVVETKVIGLALLQRYLRAESLRFFAVFSSVAGRYGNSGQSDYATANELMNRLCCQLRFEWGDRIAVKALCWGPWGATQFGAGMVSADAEAKFAAKGVVLVAADVGRALFESELAAPAGPVEVVLGEGPWEERETRLGCIERSAAEPSPRVLGPLLGPASVTELPNGAKAITFELNRNHAYLQDHLIDGTPVLPAAVALEMMAEGGAALWPEWKVVEVREFRLLRGVEVGPEPLRLTLVIESPTYDNADGFEVGAMLQSERDGKKRFHYRSVLRFERQWPSRFRYVGKIPSVHPLTVQKAYDEWLFHGPRLQVISAIEGLSEKGVQTEIMSTSPATWLMGCESRHDRWKLDPGLVDAAAQAAILWARAIWDEVALPARYGRVVCFCDKLPERLRMVYERVPTEEAHLIRANVYFTDEHNDVLMMIEDIECVSSAELKRLSGPGRFGGNASDLDMALDEVAPS